MKNLPYHQTFDGNYLWNVFKGHFDVTKNFLFFNFPKKTLKELPLKGLQGRERLFRTASEPEAIGIWVAHKPAWPEKWMVFVQRDDGHKYGVVKFRIWTEPWIFLGYGFEFSWRSWVAYFITLCWPPVSRIDSTYWTCKVVFQLRLWRNFAWKKLQCLKFLP